MKASRPPPWMRADEVVGEGLDGRVAHGQPAAVLGDVVGDRVQQVGLAEPGRAADEERVVGQARQLGHGQGGGVREPVAVADHELVERQARVELLGGGRALGLRPRRARPAVGLVGELHARAGAEHGLRARGQQPAEAGLDPGALVLGNLDDERRRRAARAGGSGSSQMCQVDSLTARRTSVRKRCQTDDGSGSDTARGGTSSASAEARGGLEEKGRGAARAANIAKGPGPDRRGFGAAPQIAHDCPLNTCQQAVRRGVQSSRVSLYAAAQRGGSVLRRALQTPGPRRRSPRT